MSSRCRTSYAGRRTFSSNSHRLRLQLAPTTKPFSFLLFRLWSLQFVGTSCAGPRCTARLRKTDRRSFTTSLTSWWRTRRSCPSPLCASTILGNNENYETGDGRGIFFFFFNVLTHFSRNVQTKRLPSCSMSDIVMQPLYEPVKAILCRAM